MAAIKISSKVEKAVWGELRALAEESHQNVSGLLTEAIREYVRRRRVRPEVLRDHGLLESPLHRPRTGYYADLAEMAAALFESLLINHPFVDGNKRVAFFATDVFLRLNGWGLEVEAGPGHRFLNRPLARPE